MTQDAQIEPITADEFQAVIKAICPDISGPAALALSGGPDSLALCALLVEVGLVVHALTVDHGLRPESAAEAAEVGRIIAGLPNVTHHIVRRDPTGRDRSRILERARQDRYALMLSYCRQAGIRHLFAAHHRDDQAETVLFRLSKGSGLDGLAGMQACTTLDDGTVLLRPLLGFSKQRLIDTCKAHMLSYVEDPSNSRNDFVRPRLRAARAAMEAEGMTNAHLALSASRLARARQALEIYAEKAMAHYGQEIDTKRSILDVGLFIDEPPEASLRVLLKLVAHMDRRPQAGAGEDMRFGPRLDRMEALHGRILSDPGFRRATLGGFLFTLDRKAGTLMVEPESGRQDR